MRYLFIWLIAIRKEQISHLAGWTSECSASTLYDKLLEHVLWLFVCIFVWRRNRSTNLSILQIEFCTYVNYMSTCEHTFQLMINYIECAKIRAHTHADMYIYSITYTDTILIHSLDPSRLHQTFKAASWMLSSLPSWLVPYFSRPFPPFRAVSQFEETTENPRQRHWVVLVYWID